MSNSTSRKKHTDIPEKMTEADLANDKMGNNQLQGNDQERVRNERQAVPDAKTEADDVLESFEKMDPKTRAERENRKEK